MSPIIPPGEGVAKPLSMRYPEQLLKRIDAIAKETRHTRTDTIMHLLRWAVTRYEEEHDAEKRGVAKPA